MARRTKVLVTGATGFLGSRLAKRLVGDGFEVRALARKSSDTSALRALNVEIAPGDLGDAPSVSAAVDGVDVVVHAAAGTGGTAEDAVATIEGTRGILDGCRKHRVAKLIYVSSCNVYEVAGFADGEVVTEEAQLERFPRRRGHYTAGKLQAEALVTAAMNDGPCSIVVLRPGTLYGSGAEVYTRMMGIAAVARRLFIVFGNGTAELPLVHVDNASDAIVECITNRAADNQIFNLVDPEVITKKAYMERVVRPLYPRAAVIYCPMSLLVALTWIQENVAIAFRTEPFLSVYRLVSSQRRIRYSASKIQRMLGWCPPASFADFAEQLLREVRAR